MFRNCRLLWQIGGKDQFISYRRFSFVLRMYRSPASCFVALTVLELNFFAVAFLCRRWLFVFKMHRAACQGRLCGPRCTSWLQLIMDDADGHIRAATNILAKIRNFRDLRTCQK